DRPRVAGPAVSVPGPVDAVRRRPTGRHGRRPALGAGRDAAGPSLTTGGKQGLGLDHRSAALASLPAPRFLASATPRRTSFLAFLLRRGSSHATADEGPFFHGVRRIADHVALLGGDRK